MPMKVFRIDLAGNNSRQLNKRAVNQIFLQWVGKGENAREIRGTSNFLPEGNLK